MRIKHAPEGSKIICCGATAEVMLQGTMGVRVKVLTIPERSGFCLGPQIWSTESIVEYAPSEQGIGKPGGSTQIGRKLPLTLF